MASTIVRELRRATTSLGAIVLAVAVTGAGCRRDTPEPTKVGPGDPAAQLKPPRKRAGPFRNPEVTPPGAREDAQLPPEKLESNLEQARRLLEQDQPIRAMHLLYRCANRTPPSARCDGELGMLLLENETRKAHADYFVMEASKLDDPKADSDFYRRLAKVSARWARFSAAAAALQRVVDRGEATAQDHADLSHALQADGSELEAAIAALARAYEMKPDQHDWLHEQAVLVAQTRDAAKAIALFEQYKKAVGNAPDKIEGIDARIATLRSAAGPAGEGVEPEDAAAPPQGSKKTGLPKGVKPPT